MPTKDKKNLSNILYPYMFMLKEGPEFKKDFLDYHLLILHTTSETIRSPASYKAPVIKNTKSKYPF
jgi:hypothetical protein